MSRNSVLQELSVRRFAVEQSEKSKADSKKESKVYLFIFVFRVWQRLIITVNLTSWSARHTQTCRHRRRHQRWQCIVTACTIQHSGGGSNLKVGGAHGERGARAYKGVWRQSPQRGLGAEPLVRGSGGEAPPEAERFLGNMSKGQAIFAPLPSFWKCWNISQTMLRIKVGLRYTKNTHTVCVNRLNCRTCSASDVQNHTVRSHYLAIIRE